MTSMLGSFVSLIFVLLFLGGLIVNVKQTLQNNTHFRNAMVFLGIVSFLEVLIFLALVIRNAAGWPIIWDSDVVKTSKRIQGWNNLFNPDEEDWYLPKAGSWSGPNSCLIIPDYIREFREPHAGKGIWAYVFWVLLRWAMPTVLFCLLAYKAYGAAGVNNWVPLPVIMCILWVFGNITAVLEKDLVDGFLRSQVTGNTCDKVPMDVWRGGLKMRESESDDGMKPVCDYQDHPDETRLNQRADGTRTMQDDSDSNKQSPWCSDDNGATKACYDINAKTVLGQPAPYKHAQENCCTKPQTCSNNTLHEGEKINECPLLWGECYNDGQIVENADGTRIATEEDCTNQGQWVPADYQFDKVCIDEPDDQGNMTQNCSRYPKKLTDSLTACKNTDGTSSPLASVHLTEKDCTGALFKWTLPPDDLSYCCSATKDKELCVGSVDNPAGCIPAPCIGTDNPYPGCDNTCTGPSVRDNESTMQPWQGCDPVVCTSANLPYQYCKDKVCRDDRTVASDPTCTGDDDGTDATGAQCLRSPNLQPTGDPSDSGITGRPCELNRSGTNCSTESLAAETCTYTPGGNTSCVINSDQSACAVEGGNCVYTPRVVGDLYDSTKVGVDPYPGCGSFGNCRGANEPYEGCT